MKPDNILGLTGLETYGAHTPDSSACLLDKENIIGAASEGRFTGNRHHAGFPWMSVKYLLSLGYSYSDIDAVAIPWPLKKKSSKHVIVAKQIYSLLSRFTTKISSKPSLVVEKKKIIGIGHQRAHASSSYRTSGFKKALVVSLDLGGPEEDVENAGGAIFVGENGELSRIKVLTASFGLFYSLVTESIGLRAVDDESKVMGMAPYGNAHGTAYNILKNYAPTVKGLDLIKPRKSFKVNYTVVNNHQRFVFTGLNLISSSSSAFPTRMWLHLSSESWRSV